MHIVREECPGRALIVRFQDQAPRHWRTGTRISVQGRLVGSELSVVALKTPVAALRENGAMPSAMVAGEQRTLVIVANFTDATVECYAKLHVGSRGDLAASAREIGLV
jgi:hypothetical protein